MKNREMLEEKLEKKIASECTNAIILKERFAKLKEFGLTEADCGQYLHMRKTLTDATDFILFCFATTYFPNQVKDYYIAKEIKSYSGIILQKEEIDKILKIKAIQISDNQ